MSLESSMSEWAALLVAIVPDDEQRLRAIVSTKLPGVDTNRMTFRAALGVPEELSAFYDDVAHFAHHGLVDLELALGEFTRVEYTLF